MAENVATARKQRCSEASGVWYVSLVPGLRIFGCCKGHLDSPMVFHLLYGPPSQWAKRARLNPRPPPFQNALAAPGPRASSGKQNRPSVRPPSNVSPHAPCPGSVPCLAQHIFSSASQRKAGKAHPRTAKAPSSVCRLIQQLQPRKRRLKNKPGWAPPAHQGSYIKTEGPFPTLSSCFFCKV